MADPTADLRQLGDHEADRDNQNVYLTLAIVAEARRLNSSSQLTVWQWLTRARRV